MNNLFSKLSKDQPHWKTEEEVRKGWLKHLENELDIRFHAERGRNDASYNQVIIEFKNKGLFKGSVESTPFKEAIYDRLGKYIPARAESEGLQVEEYIGIAIDGEHVCFAFWKDKTIKHRHLLPFNEASVDLVAQACRDAKRRAVTPENLVEDFGHSSSVGNALMGALASELEQHLHEPGNSKLRMLFEEWRTLFGQVADLTRTQESALNRAIPIAIDLPTSASVAALLFVIHTYNAFVMKMLAAEIVSEHGLSAYPDFCEHLLGLEDEDLLQRLNDEIERSAFFEDARIRGFVEEAIFAWYADKSLSKDGKKAIAAAIRSLVTQLALFRMDDLEAARSRDVLKSFYQALVPDPLRKALGEFYTPDWLVDITCDRAQVKSWLKARALDPTCGSGSFLIEIIRRKRREADKINLSPDETLELLLDTVWGFDLNPLAVQASRVNFLIAIADLISASKSEVELPILLADAVYSPAPTPEDGDDIVQYRIGSTQSDLNVLIPAELAFNRKRLDQVFAVMAEGVDDETPFSKTADNLVKRGTLTLSEAKNWEAPLAETYRQVLDLHKKDWNGIWFRIVRNFFWSAVAGKFDIVVGNPPWVRWSSLPEHYREKIKPTCEQYTIFSETPYHGGNELDISGMITYTVGDKWLTDGGTLVFVITQTHFQSPSSQGFRSFQIDKTFNFLPVSVDDLKKLKPFKNVANKTAIMKLKKVGKRKIKYPVPYRVWEKADGHTATIPEGDTKQSALKRVTILDWEATPVSGGDSPWAILPKGRFSVMSKIQGRSDWLSGRKGVTCDLNGVLLVKIVDVNVTENLVQIQTRPEAGRTKIGPAKTFWVEPDLLYPLLKGAGDFSACDIHVQEELYVFVPNRGINKKDYDEAETKMDSLPKCRRYFRAFREHLLARSTYKQRQSKAPEYVIYNVGSYTFAPYKVVWAELSQKFEAAVVSDAKMPNGSKRVFIPDHKIYFAEFQQEAEAHYVCALLNSSIIREYVQSHTIQIQVSNIFKHLKLPKFNPVDQHHKSLANLSKKAHSTKRESKRAEHLDAMNNISEKLLSS